jgi:uncharacterized protein
MKFSQNILLIFLIAFSGFAFSQIPQKPNPPRLVNDFAGALERNDLENLERKLVAFNDTTGTQILIAIVNDLGDYDAASFAFELGEKWGVGNKGFDNGIVVLVKPFGNKNQRKAFIATGYGLEGIIPDATSKSIVENEMIPYFKNNDFYGGLDNATNVLMGLSSKEFAAADYVAKSKKYPIRFLPLLIIIFVIYNLASLMNKSKKQTHTAGHTGSLMQNILIARGINQMHRGKYGSFTSGSGGFGGGGGGFGGFGGGSFGGGGAGGSW